MTLTVDQVKSLIIEEATKIIDKKIEELSNKLLVKQFRFEQDTPGIWHINIPKRAENITISASAGGATGEGLIDYEKYGADGEDTFIELYREDDTLIEAFTLEGGLTGAVPPKDGHNSADGENSSEGLGGIVPTSEDRNNQSGERRGAGGCSAGYITFSAWAGGSGEELVYYTPKEKPAKIVFSIGKGGDINKATAITEDEAGMKTSPGNGANGFARVEYLLGTIKTFGEEGVTTFTEGG